MFKTNGIRFEHRNEAIKQANSDVLAQTEPLAANCINWGRSEIAHFCNSQSNTVVLPFYKTDGTDLIYHTGAVGDTVTLKPLVKKLGPFANCVEASNANRSLSVVSLKELPDIERVLAGKKVKPMETWHWGMYDSLGSLFVAGAFALQLTRMVLILKDRKKKAIGSAEVAPQR